MDNHTKFYERLEEAEDVNGLTRACPKCDSDDCKYGIHLKEHRGFDVSICCNGCGHSETAINPDYEAIIENWHKAYNPT